MPGPGIGIALALGGALLALGLGKRPAVAATTAPLDAGIPPELDARIKNLLAHGNRPDELEATAVAAEMAGYRNAAAALRARAAQLRGQISVPGVPLDAAMPPVLDAKIKDLLARGTRPEELEATAVAADMAGYPNAAAALRARAAQLRGEAPVRGGTLDPGIPPALDARIRNLLATSSNPEELEATAVAADMAGYRNAATALRSRAAELRGHAAVPGAPPSSPVPTMPFPVPTTPATPLSGPGVPAPPEPATSPMPSPPGPPPAVPPGAPAPTAPPPPPAAAPGPPHPIEDLDANIPPALAQTVASILAKPDLTDQELAFAEQLASSCEQSGYPHAAAKLRSKTLAIRALHAGSNLLTQISQVLTAPPTSLPSIPTAIPGVPSIPAGPGTAPAPAPAVPIPAQPPKTSPGTPPPVAPLAKTYKVVRGDNPWKIAERFTGDGNKFRELAAANPDKSSRILAGKIFEGETLTLPDSWPPRPAAQTAPPRPVSVAPAVQSVPPTPPAPAPGATAPRTYVVKAGDSPWRIAQRFTGDGNKFRELADANPSKAARIRQGQIVIGETLTLPATWPAMATSGAEAPSWWGPDTVSGVLELIGARRHHAQRDRTHGDHR